MSYDVRSTDNKMTAIEDRNSSLDNGARLPRFRTTIKMYEQDNKIMLDISDETRVLGWLIDLDPIVASQLGQHMADMARGVVAKVSDSPDRKEVYVIKNPFVPQMQPARLPQSRIRKSRRVQQKSNGQLAMRQPSLK